MGMEASTTDASELTSDKSVEAANGSGSGIDFEALFNEQKQATEKFAKELKSTKGDLNEGKATLEKLKKALSPDVDLPVDDMKSELARIEAEENELYDAALKAEKAGKPISLTVKNGLRTLALEKRYLTDMKAMKEENAKLKEKAEAAADPQQAQMSLAYSNIDTLIERNLETIYGEGDEYEDVKSAQVNSITKLISKELLKQQQENPKVFQRIMRDKQAQSKLVAHFVELNMPPRVRQMLQEDEIRRTPTSTSDLVTTFREARDKGDKATAAKLRTQLFERLYSKDAGKSSRLKQGDNL